MLRLLGKKLDKVGEHSLCEMIKKRLIELGPLSLPALSFTLKDREESLTLRLLTVDIIRTIGDKRVGKQLWDILVTKDEPLTLRQSAGRALGELRLKEAVKPLAHIISNKKEELWLRKEAVKILRSLGAKEAIKTFFSILLNEKEENSLRTEIAKTLGDLNVKEAVGPLLSILRNKKENIELRRTAAGALGKLKAIDALRPLIEILLNEKDDFLKRSAVGALGALGDPRAIDALYSVLQKTAKLPASKTGYWKHWELVLIEGDIIIIPITYHVDFWGEQIEFPEVCTFALAKLGEEGLKKLVKATKDPKPGVRLYAIRELGKLEDKCFEPLLISALKDEELQIRGEALRILTDRGNPIVVRYCLNLLKDEKISPIEKVQAINSLRQFKEKRAIDILISFLKNENMGLRLEAFRTLAQIGVPGANEAIIEYLRNQKEWAKKDLEIIRERIPQPERASWWIAEIRGRVRMSCLWVIETIEKNKDVNDTRTVDLLVFLAREGEPHFVRVEALKLLGKSEDPRALEAIILSLEDENRWVRQTAIEEAREKKDPRLEEMLKKFEKEE